MLNPYKGGIRALLRQIAKALHGNQEALDVMADTVVEAALDGEPWAIQEIARAIDE